MSDVDARRLLPSIDRLLATEDAAAWSDRFGRETVKSALREGLDEIRAGAEMPPGAQITAAVLARAADALARITTPSLRRVFNGTGVVLHTNLGRARLCDEAMAAQATAAGYGNVEYSLGDGARGSRYAHCASILTELTGAAGALVVNNNAAAVSLCVNEFAAGLEVVVSRGELVEIGGSFRIPDVVSRSGASLREVGTTNRTSTADFAGAIGERTGLLLRVHPSNYRVEGFAARPEVGELAALAADHGVPFAHDIGSGLLTAALLPGFPPEPTVEESLAAGADLVTFSGDKLLGGPQAGIIVGREDLITRLHRNPLLRAFRVDKTTLAALEATLMLYRDPDFAARRIPTLRMLRESPDSVRARAIGGLPKDGGGGAPITIEDTHAVVGGGSFPGFEIDSAGWVVGRDRCAPTELAAACRRAGTPLIGRIEDGRFVVDLRTIEPGDEAAAASVLLTALADVGEDP